MWKFINFVMDPVFSESFVTHFEWMGDYGIFVLVFLKMAIMFVGTAILGLIPFAILFVIGCFIFREQIRRERYEAYRARKREMAFRSRQNKMVS